MYKTMKADETHIVAAIPREQNVTRYRGLYNDVNVTRINTHLWKRKITSFFLELKRTKCPQRKL